MAVLFSGVSLAVLPVMGHAQTPVQGGPATDVRPGSEPLVEFGGGPGDTERARAAEAERRRTYDERGPQRDRPGEWYVAGFGGVTFGHNFTDVERTGAGSGLGQDDIDLKNSVVYGGKIGYFLPDRLNWLGFEAEGFNTTPHLEQQAQPPGPICGSPRRPSIWWPVRNFSATMIELIDRIELMSMLAHAAHHRSATPADCVTCNPRSARDRASSSPEPPALEPVVRTTGWWDSTRSPGSAIVTEHVAVFGEYKYNRASFDFNSVPGGGGLSGDYSASHVVGGLSYHF